MFVVAGYSYCQPMLYPFMYYSTLFFTTENMHRVRNLRHLDLSSNQIVTMEGLTGLTHLRTLNLSCNLIEVVQGLRNLRYKS